MLDREEIDRLWSVALHEAVQHGEPYTRHRFAALVAAAEREQCAQICERLKYDGLTDRPEAPWLAAAIRARGNT